VLHEAVEHPETEASPEWQAGERRRQLQVALYLRLRQRLDREFEALARAHGPPRPPTAPRSPSAAGAANAAGHCSGSVDQALSNGRPD
jgi:hypothetical protein